MIKIGKEKVLLLHQLMLLLMVIKESEYISCFYFWN